LEPPALDKIAQPYPGESATAGQVFLLAEEYRMAAMLLLPLGRTGEPLSLAPCRFLAIHAIELYLNSLMLHAGCEPSVIRGLQHDFSARAKLAAENGLILRKRTAEHLSAMVGNREHVAMRYGAEASSVTSELNRLMATLEELADKIAPFIGKTGSLKR
jgi:hypothetical protein